MKMTDSQAIQFCNTYADLVLSRNSPSGESESIEWHRLARSIESDGLDTAEQEQQDWLTKAAANKDPRRTSNTTVATTFCDAIYDDERIDGMIAYELREKVVAEIDKQESHPLRKLYLTYLRDHLTNVTNESADLVDYHEAREEITAELRALENEYGEWIEEARKAQED